MWCYWLYAIAWEALCFGAIWVIGTIAKYDDPIGDAVFFYEVPEHTAQWLGRIVFCVFLVGYGWTLAAVSVKRLHDRAKGAIWLVLLWGVPALLVGVGLAEMSHHFLLPNLHMPFMAILVTIADVFIWWWLIELFFVRGTRGINRFGADPATTRDQTTGV